MKNGLKKMFPALAAFTTLASVICSADDMQMRNLENRVSALEQRRGSNGMINPPARPVVRDGTDLWVQAEALYMHATEDGLAYALKNNLASPDSADKIKNVNYNWSWGLRAGIGYNLPHDGWDMLLNWTWFQSSHTKKSSPELNIVYSGTQVAPSDADINYTSAKGRAKLHWNMIDFEMGREFFVSKWLTLRPFVGVRGGWVNRNFITGYKFSPDASKIKGHDHNRFRGAGLRAGLNTQWGLGSGWSFFGDLALSLIYGTQRLHSHQDETSPEVNLRIQHVHDHWMTVRPMLDLGAGLRWDHLFGDCDAYRIRIQLGWEQTTLFGFNKNLNFVSTPSPGKYTFNQGDLAFSGLSLQLRFDF